MKPALRIWWLILSVPLALAGCAAPGVSRATATAVLPAAPASLVGATPSSLQAELGAPALRRVDGPAQVWLYDSRVCRLNVILYPSNAGQPEVATAMPMPRGVSQASCLASLEQNRAS